MHLVVVVVVAVAVVVVVVMVAVAVAVVRSQWLLEAAPCSFEFGHTMFPIIRWIPTRAQ